MPLVRVTWVDPKDESRYNTHKVWIVAIDVPTETAILVHKKKFIKVDLKDVDWDAWE